MLRINRQARRQELSRSPAIEVVFVGPRNCGKTTLISKILAHDIEAAESAPVTSNTPTLGVEMSTLEYTLKGNKINMCLWDCSGQERFRPFIQQVLERATVAVLCYEHRSENSLKELQFWRNEVQRLNADTSLIIVATRSDLSGGAGTNHSSSESALSGDDLAKQMEEWRAVHIVTSSANGSGLNYLLNAIMEAGVKTSTKSEDVST